MRDLPDRYGTPRPWDLLEVRCRIEGRIMTAAARAAALLHQLDAGRAQDDPMTHAPHCSGGPLVNEQGYSVTITRCQTCGAVATERNVS